jgi:hypothetical protein
MSLFLFFLDYGTIIAMLNIAPDVKILCNFGRTGKDKRQKTKDKSGRKIGLYKNSFVTLRENLSVPLW